MQKYEFSEAQKQEITRARLGNKDKRIELRLHALALRAEGKTYKEIANYLHINATVVVHWVSRYMRNGLEDITILRYGGNHRNMSVEEEKSLLAQFEESADKGQVTFIGEMKQEYDKLIGHKSGNDTIYRLLRRHKWRKVMPRSKHPKRASAPEMEDAKNKIIIGGG
jgi:transposase